MNIEEIEMRSRAENGLRNAGIETVEDLVSLDWRQLNAMDNIGSKTVAEICWNCMRLFSGEMTKRRLEWEEKFPYLSQQSLQELRSKVSKYDKIVEICEDGRSAN